MIYRAMEEMDSLETFPSIHQVHTLLKIYLCTHQLELIKGVEYLSYVKSTETHARKFLTLNILSVSTVSLKIVDESINTTIN